MNASLLPMKLSVKQDGACSFMLLTLIAMCKGTK